VLSLVSVVMLTSVLNNDGFGTISLKGIMDYQNAWHNTGNGVLDFLFEGFTPWAWFFLVQPLMLIIYYICGLAETNRSPFDLPEAESELVAGYLTEYSGLRWALFYLGEYGNMSIVSAIASYIFLGGFSGPGVSFLVGLNTPGWGLLGNLLGLFYFIGKIYLLCVVFIWVRSTLPRLRADQLMQFAWLILIPVTLGNILLTGLIWLGFDGFFHGAPNWVFLIVLGVVNWIAMFGFFWLVTKVTTSSTNRAKAPAIRAQRRTPAGPALPAGEIVVPQLTQSVAAKKG